MALTLECFVHDLQTRHGPAMEIHRGLSDDENLRHQEYLKVHGNAVGVLHEYLTASRATTTYTASKGQLEADLRAARIDSGFDQLVGGLQAAIRQGRRPRPNELRNAVVRLASEYIQIDLSQEHLLPDIDVFQPGENSSLQRKRAATLPGTYPLVPGLNAAPPSIRSEWRQPSALRAADSHLKPKARFRSDLWRLKVPKRYLDPAEVDKLPRRLVGLASRLGYVAGLARAMRREDGQVSIYFLQAAGTEGDYRSKFSAASWKALGQALEPRQRPPTSALQAAAASSSQTRASGSAGPVAGSAWEALAAATDETSETLRGPVSWAGRPPSEDQLQGAARALRALVQSTSKMETHQLVEDVRAQLKHRAKDAHDVQQDQARQAFEASELLRMTRPYWMWCRAAKAGL